jgi:serine/threonine-protein kinase
MDSHDSLDLGAVVRNEGPLDPMRAAALVRQICGTLSAIHDEGRLHLDITPARLVIERGDDGTERVRLLDPVAVRTGDDAATTVPGSTPELPFFQAPEQLRRVPDVDRRTDVYSAGAVLYTLLTGMVPFQAVSRADLALKVSVSSPPPPRSIRPEIPPALEQVVLRAMARQPSDRFSSMRDLADALDPLALSRPPVIANATAAVVPPTVVAGPYGFPAQSFGQPSFPASQGYTPGFPVAPRPPPPLRHGSGGGSAVGWIIGISVGIVVLGVMMAVVLGVLLARTGGGPSFGPDAQPFAQETPPFELAPMPIAPQPLPPPTPPFDTKIGAAQVDVTVCVMSQCPFGVAVVGTMTSLARKIGPGMQLDLEYIGTDVNGELSSMHGQSEVDGDRLQLCVQRHATYTAWLDYLDCQNQRWREIPAGWQECVLYAGVDFETIRVCSTGPEGDALLRESFARSREKNALGSPTIFIAGVQHSGDRGEDVLGPIICSQFPPGLAPSYCVQVQGQAVAPPDVPHDTSVPEGIGEPASIPVRILVDQRCKTRECGSVERFESLIRREVPGAEITRIDVQTLEGMALWRHLKIVAADAPRPAGSGRPFGLPLALFGSTIEQAGYYSRLSSRMIRVGDEHMFQLGSWDPESEICDDLIDNNGDDRVDCQDPGCEASKVCRPEQPRKLSVFVMSQCPFAIKVLDGMDAVLTRFGRDRSRLDFRIEFIGRVQDDGAFYSMHGQGEVDEDLRMACAQHYYGGGYAFMDYVLCRNRDFRSPEWRSCVHPPLDASVIQECAEGPEGRTLLRESFGLARSLEITGSPTWLLNNRYDMQGREPDAISAAYCERNAVAGCPGR